MSIWDDAMNHPRAPRRPALPHRSAATGSRLATAVASLLVLSASALHGQDVDARSPNLSDGWVGEPSSARFNFNHRFWLVGGDPGERKVVNSPTMLLGFPLPGRLLVAGRYASNSLVIPDTFNELEGFVRWAPALAGPVGAAFTVAYNNAAASLDGELSLRVGVGLPEAFPGDSIQILAAVRGLQDALGTGEPGWFAGAGLLVHLSPNVALAADVGTLESDGLGELSNVGVDIREVWGAGLQLRIPTTPHTLSLHAANTTTSTLQGSSAGLRTVWGFEFTVPLTYARFLP